MPTDTPADSRAKTGVSPSNRKKTKSKDVDSEDRSKPSKIERLKGMLDKERASRTRSEQASTRLTPGEYSRLADLSDELGISMASTVRILVIGGMSESLLPEKVVDDMSKLRVENDRLVGLLDDMKKASEEADLESLRDMIAAAHSASKS